MTLAEAIAIVSARPGHRRYRDLCDPNHPEFNPDYEPVVLRLAAEPFPPAPATAAPTARQSVALVRRMNACLFRSAGASCGCAGAGRCALRHGAVISHLDCFACLTQYPDLEDA